MSATWSLPSSGSIWTDNRQGAATGSGSALPPTAAVVVVGAGVCGLVTAAMLVERGLEVVVLDAGDGSESVSMRSSAKVSVLHELTAAKIARRRGRSVAMQYIAANRFGWDWIDRYVRERDVDCSWEPRDAVTYVNEASSFDELELEASLYRSAGVDVTVDEPYDVPFELSRSVTARHQAQFDPAAFLDSVAENLAADGNAVLYGTRVRGVGRGRKAVSVHTSIGDIVADHVVVATGLPFLDRGLFFARADPRSSYVVACEVESEPEPAMYLSADGEKRSIRSATTVEGTRVLLVGGEGHKTGQGGDTEQHYRTLGAWANEHFGVRAITHRFTAQDYVTADHVPFAGPLTPGNDRVFVATGMNKWGFSNSPAAAAVNVARIVGDDAPAWGDAYASTRLPVSGLPTLARAGLNVASHMVGGWAAALTKTSDPEPGHGHVRFAEGRPIARSSSCTDASIIGVDGKCPHLGGSLAWNPAENTWDCPLHGSRFEADGRLLHGPAVDDLARRSP